MWSRNRCVLPKLARGSWPFERDNKSVHRIFPWKSPLKHSPDLSSTKQPLSSTTWDSSIKSKRSQLAAHGYRILAHRKSPFEHSACLSFTKKLFSTTTWVSFNHKIEKKPSSALCSTSPLNIQQVYHPSNNYSLQHTHHLIIKSTKSQLVPYAHQLFAYKSTFEHWAGLSFTKQLFSAT